MFARWPRIEPGDSRNHEVVDYLVRPHVRRMGLPAVSRVLLDYRRTRLSPVDSVPGGHRHQRARRLSRADHRARVANDEPLPEAGRVGDRRLRSRAVDRRCAGCGLAGIVLDVSQKDLLETLTMRSILLGLM